MDDPDFVQREDWGARDAKHVDRMEEAKYIEVTWTDTDTCSNREECIKRVKEIQNKHMDEEGEPDIKYNFLISPDEQVFVGRGWNGGIQVSSQDRDPKYEKCDGKTLVIAYIGPKGYKSSPRMILAGASLAAYGIKNEYLPSNVELITPDEEEEEVPSNVEMKRMASNMDMGLLG